VIARDRLLDIAEDLMSRRGYAGTSVSDIVGAAGVGPPTLYWHFNNKQGILAAVMERGAERWLRSLPRWDDVPTGTPRERFITAIEIGGKGVADDPQFVRLLMLLALERGERDEAVIGTIRSIRRRSRAWMIGLLQAAWPPMPRAAAEGLAFKMMSFADGWCLRQMVEPEFAALIDLTWLSNTIADEAQAIAARPRPAKKRL
jgi:AcrR family transcriptional regulator